MKNSSILSKLNNFFQQTIHSLLCPFGEYLSFFVTAFILSSIVELMYNCLFDNYKVATLFLMHHFIICYFLVLPIVVIPLKFQKIYEIISYILLFVNFTIDFICVFAFHSRFRLDFADIIIGTNFDEASDFISTYITFPMIAMVLIGILGFILIHRISVTIHLNLRVQICCFIGVVFSILYINLNEKRKYWDIISLGKIKTFLSIPTVDLKEYQKTPMLAEFRNIKPQNIVVIIGESFSKTHSSLYGYNKVTNPQLQALYNDSLLYIFNNINASGLHTINAFKGFMSTFSTVNAEQKTEWYKCLTLPNVLRTIGYHTLWLSNQSQKGFYDNIITNYAELCDSMVFMGDRYAGLDKKDKDGGLIPIVDSCIYNNKILNKEYNFYFCHLLGSHYVFEHRYPVDFNKWSEKDYLEYAEHQRKVLATYDNSVLYNDYVVSHLISLFKDEETIIIYFSDHALDLFNSSDDYFGHALANNQKSCEAGRNIPFMVYVSHKFELKFPQIVQRINKNINKSFNTDNLIYTIMDIAGVHFKDNDDVCKYSLLN